MSKGSTWNIWDFHLHTPYSTLNNQFGDPNDEKVWDTYISNVESKAQEKSIVAIAFTDYFTIDGYKKVLEYQNKGRLQNILVMPNIEFRIDKIIYRNKDGNDPKRLNFHVIFSPEVSPREIEESFLHDLDFFYESEPFDKSRTKKLKPYNLEEFGKSLKAQEPRFTGSDLEVGCKTVVVPLEKIKENLAQRFHGRHILALADENLSLIEWGSQDHPTRQQLIQMSHVVLSSNQGTREFCLGKRHPSVNDYLREFKSYKPCIWGCDSHSFAERFLEPDEKRYTWIKGDVTWDGLKQVLYEPSDRVCIQDSNPEHPKSIFTLESVKVDDSQINPSLHLKQFETELNPNLVTIIGGRGSGKTALLDLIASLFREGEKLSSLKNSFFYRVFCDDYGNLKEDSSVNILVGFKSGENASKQVGRDTGVFDRSDVLYLTQSHFDEYSADPSKLNAYIIELVFEGFPDEKRKYKEMQEEVEELEQKIQNINLEVDQLIEEINGQLDKENTNLNIKKGEKDDFSQRLKLIQEKQGAENEEILKLTGLQEELKVKKREMESLLYQLSEFISFVREFNSEYQSRASELNKNLPELLNGKKAKHFLEKIHEIQLTISYGEDNEKEIQSLLQDTESEILKSDRELGALEGLSLEIANLQTKIADISLEIEEIEQAITIIKEKQERISSLEAERFSVYSSIMQKMVSKREYLQEVIDKFETGKDEMLDNLEFSASIDTSNISEFVENLLDKIDNRVNSPSEVNDRYLLITKEVNTLLNSTEKEKNFLEVVDKLKEFGLWLKRKRSVSLSDLYNTLLERCFVIGLHIKFSGKDLSELSMGERAVVLLKVLLSLDDTPLLIDQPEEHLDNRYIYNELVPAFRKAKTKRQIIIATHNANLVVNTDAEQVIVAKYESGNLSYEVGTLENIATREQIKAILEGGDEAFKKREEKYGYIF